MSGSYNVGRDVTLDIIDPDEGELRFSIITGFEANARTQQLESRPLSGEALFADLPDGWEGTLEIDRANAELDRWYARRETAYFRGARLNNISITETVNEIDGSVTSFRYTNVSMTLSGGRTVRGNEKVPQRVTWRASRREIVS